MKGNQLKTLSLRILIRADVECKLGGVWGNVADLLCKEWSRLEKITWAVDLAVCVLEEIQPPDLVEKIEDLLNEQLKALLDSRGEIFEFNFTKIIG